MDKKYLWNGNYWSEEDINEAAKEDGLSVDNYLTKHGITIVSEREQMESLYGMGSSTLDLGPTGININEPFILQKTKAKETTKQDGDMFFDLEAVEKASLYNSPAAIKERSIINTEKYGHLPNYNENIIELNRTYADGSYAWKSEKRIEGTGYGSTYKWDSTPKRDPLGDLIYNVDYSQKKYRNQFTLELFDKLKKVNNAKDGAIDFIIADDTRATQKNIIDFFGGNEEEAVAQLKTIFGDYYSYETGSNKYNLENVTLTVNEGPHKGESVSIGFGFEGDVMDLAGGYGFETSGKREKYLESLSGFVNFINKTITTTDNIKNINKNKSATLQVLKEETKKGGDLYVDVDGIQAKYNDPNLFNPIEAWVENTDIDFKSDIFLETDALRTVIPGQTRHAPNAHWQMTQPYEQELENARKQLLRSGFSDENITEETIQAATRQMLIREEITTRFGENVQKMMNSDKYDGSDLDFQIKVASKIDIANDRKKLAAYELEFKDYQDKILGMPELKRINEINEILNNPNKKFNIGPNEEYVTLKDGRKMPKSLNDQYMADYMAIELADKDYQDWYKIHQEKVMDILDTHNAKEYRDDLLQRNYNDWEKFYKTLGSRSLDMFMMMGFGQELLKGGILGGDVEVLEEAGIASRKSLNDWRHAYQKDIEFKNAFSDGNFGHWLTQELGNQIPVYAALFTPIGYGIIGTSSYGSNWLDMVEQDKLNGTTSSLLNKTASSLGVAAADVVFDRLLTSRLTMYNGSMNGLWRGKNAMMGGWDGIKLHVKQNGKRMLIYDGLLESSSEGLTTVFQNLIMGRPLTENLAHSMFSGGMFGFGTGHGSFYIGAIKGQFSDYGSKKLYRENLITIDGLVIKRNSLFEPGKELYTINDKEFDNEADFLAELARMSETGELGKAKKGELNISMKKDGETSLDNLTRQVDAILGSVNADANVSKTQTSAKVKKDTDLEVLKAIENEIKTLEAKNETIMKEIDDKMNSISKEWFDAYNGATVEQEKIRAQVKALMNDKKLGKKQLNLLVNSLQNRFDALQRTRDILRDDKAFGSKWAGFQNSKNTDDVKRKEELLKNAEQQLITDGTANPSKEQINESARLTYNAQEINNDYKNKRGKTKLGKSLENYQTVEEAVAAINQMDDVSDKDKAAAIKNIEDGGHGANMPTTDGGFKPFQVVENMAKDDRLETRTHELGHTILSEAFSMNPEAFDGIAEQILEHVRLRNPNLYTRLLIVSGGKSDEVITNYLEFVAEGKMDLKNKKNGRIGAMFAWMLGNGVRKATKSDVEFNFEGETDAITFITALAKKIKAGTLTLKERKAIKKSKIAADVQKKDVGVKETKLSKATPLEAINKLIPKDVKTKKEYDALLADPRRNKDIFNAITQEGGVINNYIRSRQVSKEEGDKTIENTVDRVLGFNPEEKRKDGTKVGIEGFGERIFADTRFGKLDAKKALAIEAARLKQEKSKDISETTKEGEVKMQIAAEETTTQEKLETEDLSPAARAKKKKAKEQGKTEEQKQSEFRRKVGFKTGSPIYNEILEAARKSLMRAYAKTKNIKDIAARERAIVAEIQKEHNSLNSPLFKQLKNWLTYGMAQERVPRGTKDIYFSNLKEFREDIVKLISTSDLVQIERLINESDRIFTIYKQTLTRKGDVEQAVNENRLPPDALRKYDKDKKVNEYDKVIPSETQIVAFANQPAKIPAKDKQGNIMTKDGEALMIRSGLKGTRKDGIAKNLSNGLVLDAVMQARQSKEVRNLLLEGNMQELVNNKKITKEDADNYLLLPQDVQTKEDIALKEKVENALEALEAKKVGALSAVIGRPIDVKLSKAIGKNNPSAFIQEINSIGLTKKHATNFGKDDRQRRLAATAFNTIIKEIDNQGVYSSLVPMFTHMQEKVNEGLLFNEIINSTYNEHVKGNFEGVEGNLYAKFFEGSFSKKHLAGILGLAKRITEAQINDIAFNDAINDLIKNPSDNNIKYFLRQHSKQIRTSKFVYNGNTITKNSDVFEHIINPIQKNNKFGIKKVPKGTRITFDGKEQLTYQNSTETKEVFKNNDPKEVTKALETNTKESDEAINFTIDIVESNKTSEIKKAIVKSFFADTDAGGRKIAKFGIMTVGHKGETVLDHRIPVNKVIEEIFKTIDNPTSQNISNLRNFLENTRINNIPVKVNELLNKPIDKKGLGKKIEGGMEVMENTRVVEAMDRIKTKSYNGTKFSKSTNFKVIEKAVMSSRITKESRGITVLDFDDTLATTESLVKFTRPDGTTGTLNAEQYASTYESLLGEGYTFDFSEFNKVVKGKIAPLFQKALKLQGKFGPENMFVLTARPPAAQKAIFDFLKANGLNIPIKNITGLGNSTSEAKALWMSEKVGEGYNDFYFADDALQNVQAVKNMLSQFDVKSKVQQAKVKFSKAMDKNFNDILENITGIESEKRFSAIKARKRGADKGRFRFFIPPSHEDFVGLLYNFMGKGKEGNAHRDFWEQSLIRPLNRAYRELNTAKQSIANDYKSLNKQFKDVKSKLTKKTPDGDFTYQDAIRVYLWNKHGHKVPGLSKTDQTKLTELVMSDPDLQAYAETLNVISKQDAYVNPTESWEAGDIRTDLDDATGRVGREQFFTEFNENAKIIFSEENLNKIEAVYGKGVREAIEDILYRTKTGRNRPSGQNKLVNIFMTYLNGSVASTMFFNMRSAVLQQMSMVNFINFADNNIYAAAKAFANQKQYWADWAYIFNSDFMKQRRGGIKTDVNGAELAASLRGARNTPRALLAKLLELGFLPTQIGDNIAIATGGATFLRNRINTYLKQGFNKKEAESKAWTDFQVLAEATQQSARPDMVSQQQASPLGKVILAFQNVTSQFNRLGKKAFLDIKNRRITPGNTTQFQSDVSNVSRITYYFAVQNLIFYALQSALFTALFDDDDEDERFLKKKERMVNGSIDSVLRGAGVWGAVVATLKNMAIKWHEQRDKGWNKDESAVLMEALNVSPPLGIKARKIVNAERTLNYNEKVIDEMETLDIDNPMWSAVTNYIEATTNAPTNRLYNKTQNVRESLNNQHSALERALMFAGWSKWNLGIGDSEKIKTAKESIKNKKKMEKYGVTTMKEVIAIDKSKEIKSLNKKEQIEILKSMGADYWKIKRAKKEQDRVDEIMKYWNKNQKKVDSLISVQKAKPVKKEKVGNYVFEGFKLQGVK